MERKIRDSKQYFKEVFDGLEPFFTTDNIPLVPHFDNPDDYNEIVVKNLIRCGAIPKDKLKVGSKYEGECRNTNYATWDGEKFTYKRYKFGDTFEEDINHFQDDDGYDVFVPLREVPLD
jgi:hypothetical protein